MIIERIKAAGIAHYSYFIGSHNYAAVLDPRRDCRVYLQMAEKYSLKIRYILETHRNEDYVIGSLELSKITGAGIYHGPGLNWKYGNTLKDGENIEFDNIKFTAIHTPGHTDESTSYLLTDVDFGAPVMVFTGDTLFVGDTGRTDLYGTEQAPRLAAALYDSLFKRLLPMGESIIIAPAHGYGSICGGKIAERDESTLGIELKYNPKLKKDREEFIKNKLSEHLELPPYFKQMEKYNLAGPPILGQTPKPEPMTPSELLCEIGNGAVVVDTRRPYSFSGSHIKNSLSIWMEGLPSFAGWVLSYDQPFVLVLEDASSLDTAVQYMVRLGFDRIVGYLKGSMEEWATHGFPIEALPMISVHELQKRLKRHNALNVLDVRDQDEWTFGHIAGALHIYVGHLKDRLSEIPRDKPVAVICSVGNRASLGASILLRAGYENVYNVAGGMMGWTAAGFAITTE